MTNANAPLDAVLAHVDATIEDSVARLFDLLRIASISTDPAYKDECRKAAEWLAGELGGLGFDASVRATEGHPMVVGHAKADTGPNVLFYGHYDVQPVDPLELWANDPSPRRSARKTAASDRRPRRGGQQGSAHDLR